MAYNVISCQKLLKTLKFWKSLNSLCKSGSRPQKSPKNAQKTDHSIAIYSNFWIGMVYKRWYPPSEEGGDQNHEKLTVKSRWCRWFRWCRWSMWSRWSRWSMRSGWSGLSAKIICIQKIFGFNGLNHQIINKRWDVTLADTQTEFWR